MSDIYFIVFGISISYGMMAIHAVNGKYLQMMIWFVAFVLLIILLLFPIS